MEPPEPVAQLVARVLPAVARVEQARPVAVQVEQELVEPARPVAAQVEQALVVAARLVEQEQVEPVGQVERAAPAVEARPVPRPPEQLERRSHSQVVHLPVQAHPWLRVPRVPEASLPAWWIPQAHRFPVQLVSAARRSRMPRRM